MKLSEVLNAVAPFCNDTEALLSVSYDVTQDIWDNLYAQNDTLRFSPRLTVRPSGTTGNSTIYEYIKYESFEDIVDFELCVPKVGSCLEVTVSKFPIDSYIISWDGRAVETGPDFSNWGQYHITSTEVGDFCYPVCNENEALFELLQWTGSGYSGSYRVEDNEGNKKVLGCDSNSNSCTPTYFKMYTDRACLPRYACYHFLIGGHTQWTSSSWGDAPYFSVSFDDELLTESESWLFKSVSFGEGCSPQCNHEYETKAEIFVYRTVTDCQTRNWPDLQWELTSNSAEGSEVIENGAIDACSNTPLFHRSLCVPKGCASFFISSEPFDGFAPTTLQLSMDDIVYRKTMLFLSNSLNQTTNMGNCSVGDLCDRSAQALFELDLQAITEHDQLAFDYWAIDWNFGYSDPNRREDGWRSLLQSSDYVNLYDLGSTYRTVECVSDEECVLDFNMTANAPVQHYTIKRNGVELKRETREHEWRSSLVEVTEFGELCASQENGLSGGAIAGIVIGCCIVVLVAVALGFRRYKKQEEGIPEGLSEDLLQQEN